MRRLIWHWILSAAALWLAATALKEGVKIAHWYTVLWLAPLLGLVNMVVGLITGIIKLIALPVNLLTLGCFGFVLSFICNGLAVWYLSQNLHPEFTLTNFWWGVALVGVMALFSMLLNMVLPGKNER